MIDYKNINIEDLIYISPVKSDNYYKSEILYNENKLIIITDEVKVNGNELELSEDLKIFINKIEKNHIENTYKNGKEWFKKDIPFEIINGMYVSKLNNNILEIKNEKNIELENEKVILIISGLRIERKTFTMDIILMDKYGEYNLMEFDLLEDIEENKKKELFEIKNKKEKLKEEFEILEKKNKIIKEKITELEEMENEINNNSQ